MFQRGFIRIVLHFQRVTEIREVVKNVSCPIPVRADALGHAGGQIIDFGADIRKLEKPAWKQ